MNARVPTAAAFALLLTGCSALTIDVDVYKGPLANEEEVQVQQLTVIAVGARPLLLGLRKGLNKAKHKNEVKRVDAILGLYEDQVSEELTGIVERGLDAYGRYERAYAMSVVDKKRDKALWNAVSEDMSPFVAHGDPRYAGLDETQRASLQALVEKLETSYRDLIYPLGAKDHAWRKERGVLTTHIELLAALAGQPEVATRLGLARMRVAGIDVTTTDDVKRIGANGRYELLSQKALVASHARLLFKGKKLDGKGARFRARVQRIGRSFGEAREELSKLLHASLDFIERKDDPGVTAQALDLATQIALQAIWMRKLHEVAAGLSADDALAADALVVDLPVVYPPGPEGWQELEAIVRQHFRMAPVDTARTLVDLDARFRRLAPHEQGDGGLSREFGIVRGPFPLGDDSDASDPEVFESLLARFTDEVGFDRGRLTEGIDSLIECVLAEEPGSKPKLYAALVRFSEKLRLIASFEPLLERTGSARGLRQYIDVLEAVANSIQTQVDFLKRRMDYEDALAAHGAGELAGYAAAETLGGASDQLPDFSGEAKRPHEVIDLLITTLRYELVLAIKESGDSSDEVARLRAAIAAAMDQRSGMAFLRPAVAFLRNSYPASSLQSDSSVTWRNMLQEHGWRSARLSGPDEDRNAVRQSFDKQYWQNVNRVRMVGAGSTNYVIAKDDIGNWYAKSYSTNVDKIVESMEQLATFALGAGVTTTTGGGETQTAAPASAGDGRLLKRIVDNTTEAKNERTAAVHASLASGIAGARAALRGKWESIAFENLNSDPASATTERKQRVDRLDYVWATTDGITLSLPAASASDPAQSLFDGIGSALKTRDALNEALDQARLGQRILEHRDELAGQETAADAALVAAQAVLTQTTTARTAARTAITSKATKKTALDAARAADTTLQADPNAAAASQASSTAALATRQTAFDALPADSVLAADLAAAQAAVTDAQAQVTQKTTEKGALAAQKDAATAALGVSLTAADLTAARAAVTKEYDRIRRVALAAQLANLKDFERSLRLIGDTAAPDTPTNP